MKKTFLHKDKALELIVQGESKDLLIYQIN